MRLEEQGGQPVSVAPKVFAYAAPRSLVILAMSAGGTRSAITPHNFTPRAEIEVASRRSANLPTIPGMSRSQPIRNSATSAARWAASKPSTTNTVPPVISVQREYSAPPM
jgi:hypothetical protein